MPGLLEWLVKGLFGERLAAGGQRNASGSWLDVEGEPQPVGCRERGSLEPRMGPSIVSPQLPPLPLFLAQIQQGGSA